MKPLSNRFSNRDIPVLMFFNLDRIDWTEKDQKDVLELVQALKAALEEIGYPVIPLMLENSNINGLFSDYSPSDYIVFNWCEGIPGIPHSFGKAAAVLEELGYAYTGSTAKTLDLNDDKRKVKDILFRNHVSTPAWQIYENGSNISTWNKYPAIVKPAFEHCSVGISPESIAGCPMELEKRAKFINQEFHQPAIIEEFIEGREFQVGVWGNGPIEVLPAVEADFSKLDDPRDHLCTMDSKDDPNSYRYQKWNMILPAPLSQNEIIQLTALCTKAYLAIGVRDYARMDVRYKDGTFYLLDVNTNPYIGPECGLIQAAKIAGYSYGEFGSRLVHFAWQRKIHPQINN
jgi:D-alanine-D-alanine ligase